MKVATSTIVLILILTSCAISETIEKMESNLNSKIGTVYRDADSRYFHALNETSSHTEMELKRNDGCSYAFLINKNTKIIESWRFTSDRSLCKSINRTGA